MTKLGELYTDFSRIDLDMRGGYARVAQVRTLKGAGFPKYCAFKLMRHDLVNPNQGIGKFEAELRTLVEITSRKSCPDIVTKIFDSGYVSSKLSEDLKKPLGQIENTKSIESINSELEAISTGTDLQSFVDARRKITNKGGGDWLPYLVVQLVPYDDNLLRQIRLLSAGNISDLYRFNTNEIVSMSLQILDLLDYLHNNHNFAYMDWKPEHVYWNGLNSRLSVIDWNVANHFQNERERKILIREDVRLFCGAVLYCSLALNDPEDIKRPIGPEPISSQKPLFLRYWTDRPNFYERDLVLDERIKLLVQAGLDPKQGFESPSELKEQLLAYAEQELGLSAKDLSPAAIGQARLAEIQELLADADDAYSRGEFQRSIQLYQRILRIEPNNELAREHLAKTESELSKTSNSGTDLPREATQLYRSARSYISAKDYQEAIKNLADAVEIAFKKHIIFREAQQLLDTVKISLEVEKVQQSIKMALDRDDRDTALALYKKAIDLDPNNNALKSEFNSLNSLVVIDAELRGLGIKRFISLLNGYLKQLKRAKDVLSTDNPVVKSVERQISFIRLTQLIFAMILVLFCFALYPFWGRGVGLVASPTHSALATPSPSRVIPENSNTKTPTPAPESTPLITSTATLTETPTPTPPLVTLGTGYISFGLVSSWDEPNGKFIEKLTQYQVVTIYEKINDHGNDWYRCTWEKDGIVKEGWILAEYIKIGAPPVLGP